MKATAARDLALSAVKAALSATTPLGAVVASLISDAVQAHTDKAIKRAIELLRDQIDRLQDRIDLDAVNRDELAEVSKACYFIILRTTREEKLRAATSLIANTLLREGDPDRLDYDELDHFIRCIDSLSAGAISVLGQVYDMALAQKQDPRAGEFRFNFSELHSRMPETSAELLMGLIGELNAMNLVHLPGAPSVRGVGYANYRLELTLLGTAFVDRLLRFGETPEVR